MEPTGQTLDGVPIYAHPTMTSPGQTPEQVAALKADWEKLHTGPGSMMILPNGFTVADRWTVGADGIRRLPDGTPVPTPAPDGNGFLVPPEFHPIIEAMRPADEPHVVESPS